MSADEPKLTYPVSKPKRNSSGIDYPAALARASKCSQSSSAEAVLSNLNAERYVRACDVEADLADLERRETGVQP